MNNSSTSFRKGSNDLLVYSLDRKKILWLPEINKYLVIEPIAFEIIRAVLDGKRNNSIVKLCRDQYQIEEEQINSLVNDIRRTLSNLRRSVQQNLNHKKLGLLDFTTTKNKLEKYYKINNIVFFVEYETSRAAEINHPKLSHFEIQPVDQFDHYFKVFHSNNTYSLIVDGENTGTWKEEESHFLAGKFSMQILQQLYGRKEDEWLGVFHAAGVSDDKKCILFLGDSGNGKSTLSALLMANGFHILSDDFLPVENKNMHVCRFPAAISVKKDALSILGSEFPGLVCSPEYFNPESNKTFRFLPLSESNLRCVPCIALIFVKYEPNSGLQLDALPKDIAFQKLIPDSWISPIENNVESFLQWFGNLPCLQLKYSDNKAMIEAVKNIFNNG